MTPTDLIRKYELLWLGRIYVPAPASKRAPR